MACVCLISVRGEQAANKASKLSSSTRGNDARATRRFYYAPF